MDVPAIEALKGQVALLKWYHTIDLGHGIVTPGLYDHRPYLDFYGLPENLSGKTALDIGTASGFFAFELEKRGATVTATDLPAWMDHDFSPIYQPDQTPEESQRYLLEPFALAKRVLNSRVEKCEINIYDISPETIGTFDLVFCGSVLLHLTDPVKALWHIQTVTKGVAIIATSIFQDGGAEPRAQFIGHNRGDGYWIPNRSAMEAMVQSAGFAGWEWISEFRLDYRDGQPGSHHGVIRAWNSLESFELPSPKQNSVLSGERGQKLSSEKQPITEQEAEIARLRELIDGYERGYFIRFMRWIRNLKTSWLGH